jgi:hypothetical protein
VLDALKMFDRPLIELHISNIHKREAIYHRSLVSTVATAVIAGSALVATPRPSAPCATCSAEGARPLGAARRPIVEITTI